MPKSTSNPNQAPKESTKKVDEKPVAKFHYLCPSCTKVAIVTTNKMLGVEVDCAECGTRIKLDDPNRYKAI